ncbi:MAG: hypothetical protein WDM89_11925 [Rhizomicrobium sp.]
MRPALAEAGHAIARQFFALEALLVEINPLFVRKDGSWIAGDAKLVIDENALLRQTALRTLIEEDATLYPEAALKMAQGFDFVVLDPGGDIGLVTTGAGLRHAADRRAGGARGIARSISVTSAPAASKAIRAG